MKKMQGIGGVEGIDGFGEGCGNGVEILGPKRDGYGGGCTRGEVVGGF